MTHRRMSLPPNLPPLGLSREESAEYIGVSPTKFDEMVADGRMPPAKRIDGRRVWSRIQLDKSFAALPDGGASETAGNVWANPAV